MKHFKYTLGTALLSTSLLASCVAPTAADVAAANSALSAADSTTSSSSSNSAIAAKASVTKMDFALGDKTDINLNDLTTQGALVAPNGACISSFSIADVNQKPLDNSVLTYTPVSKSGCMTNLQNAAFNKKGIYYVTLNLTDTSKSTKATMQLEIYNSIPPVAVVPTGFYSRWAGSSGTFYISDTENSVVRKVSGGNISTVIGDTSSEINLGGGAKNPELVNSPAKKDIQAPEVGMKAALVDRAKAEGGHNGDGGIATSATVNYPAYVIIDTHGNLIISDQYNQAIRYVAFTAGTYYNVVMTAGNVYTVAGANDPGGDGYSGDGGAAISATLEYPTAIAIDSSNNLYIADFGNNVIREVDHSTGIISTVVGNGVQGPHKEGGLATASHLNNPSSVAVDSKGNIVIADSNNNMVEMVPKTSGTYFGVSMTAGNIYKIAGTGDRGYSIGRPGTSAQISYPIDVAFDSADNLFIADMGNSVIDMLPVASKTYYGISMTASNIYTIAGTAGARAKGISGEGAAATSATFARLGAIAVDSSGNVYLADMANNIIRKIDSTDKLTTVAGSGDSGFSGDGGAATSAELRSPFTNED